MTIATSRDRPAWPGAFNLADVGGLPLLGGGVTRRERVFRSGRPEYVTPDGWRSARDAGVTTVIDLRNPGEAAREVGAPARDAEATAGIRFASCPTEDPDDPQFASTRGSGSRPVLPKRFPTRSRSWSYGSPPVGPHLLPGSSLSTWMHTFGTAA